MNYIDVLRESEDMVTPGMSACQGCGGELILRTVLQVAGKNTIIGIPPGCMAGAGVVGWNYSNGLKIPVHIPLLDNTASFLTGQQRIVVSRVCRQQQKEMKKCCISVMTMKAT